MESTARIWATSNTLRLTMTHQTIPLIRKTNADGSVTEFTSADAKSNAGPWRTMDCIDCHNRPAHSFDTPEGALDKKDGSRNPFCFFTVRSQAGTCAHSSRLLFTRGRHRKDHVRAGRFLSISVSNGVEFAACSDRASGTGTIWKSIARTSSP